MRRDWSVDGNGWRRAKRQRFTVARIVVGGVGRCSAKESGVLVGSRHPFWIFETMAGK